LLFSLVSRGSLLTSNLRLAVWARRGRGR